MLETCFQILILIPFFAYFSVKYYYNYWNRKNVPCVESSLLDLDWYYMPMFDYYAKIYRQLEGYRFGGFFMRFSPMLMIRDPDLIKRILVEDFEYFHDREDVVFDENEPITMNIFNAPKALWKNLRRRLTPTFTSGEMKYMFSLVQECAEKLIQQVNDEMESDIDVNDFSIRYAIEVISSCAFGLKSNSIEDRDSVLKVMAYRIVSFSFTVRITFWTRSILPWFKRVFRLRMVNKSVTQFFHKLIEDNVKYRRKNSIERNDFLQLLMNVQDKEEGHGKFKMTTELMTAQCFIFFGAGFAPTSAVLTFALYELAANQEVQKRLQDEIKLFVEKSKGEITYDMMNSMPYLHQVVLETLRKYPTSAGLTRICNRRYQIPDSDMVIDKGTEIVIPVSGIHRDSKYYPNSNVFDPDRYENFRNLSNRCIFLPFGGGPRNCIGLKFALMSVKVGLIQLLLNFNFEISTKTRNAFRFQKLRKITSVDHEIYLKCNKK